MDHSEVVIRQTIRPGDLGRVTTMHGEVYSAEYGFDLRFESYVADTVGEFGKAFRPERDRLWLAERDGVLVGSIGIVGREHGAAQLRWLLVAPAGRGCGLGRRLLRSTEGARVMVATHREMAGIGEMETQRTIVRIADETKPSVKSTELYMFVLAVIGVLYAAREADNFAADQAWMLVTALTIGYMVSRGLSKSGSQHSGDN